MPTQKARKKLSPFASSGAHSGAACGWAESKPSPMMIVPPARPWAVKPSGSALLPALVAGRTWIGGGQRGTPGAPALPRHHRGAPWRRDALLGSSSSEPPRLRGHPTMPRTRESATAAFFQAAMGVRSAPARRRLRGSRSSRSFSAGGSASGSRRREASLRAAYEAARGGNHGPGHDAISAWNSVVLRRSLSAPDRIRAGHGEERFELKPREFAPLSFLVRHPAARGAAGPDPRTRSPRRRRHRGPRRPPPA